MWFLGFMSCVPQFVTMYSKLFNRIIHTVKNKKSKIMKCVFMCFILFFWLVLKNNRSNFVFVMNIYCVNCAGRVETCEVIVGFNSIKSNSVMWSLNPTIKNCYNEDVTYLGVNCNIQYFCQRENMSTCLHFIDRYQHIFSLWERRQTLAAAWCMKQLFCEINNIIKLILSY